MRNKAAPFLLLAGIFSVLRPGVVSAADFNIGDRVRTTAQLWVRSNPWIDNNKIWLAPKESTGLITDGPASDSGYTWWKVNYDVGIEGWSAEGYPGGVDYLEMYAPAYTTADTFQYPLTVTWDVSQDFGGWNSGWGGYHLAEDVLTSAYTQVYASANGKVRYASTSVGGYGSLIIIEHRLSDNSYVCTLYGHLSRSKGLQVSAGQTVSKGELIAYIGDSSENDGDGLVPHIHFGIRKGGYSTESSYCGRWLYVGYSQSCTGCTHEQYRDMWRDPTDFVEPVQKPDPPSLSSPGSSSSPGPEIDDLTPTFHWSSGANADYYGLYIRNLDTDVLVFDSEEDYGPIYGTSFDLPSGNALGYGTHYRWNMASHNSAGWSYDLGTGFSGTLWFTTYEEPTPEPPTRVKGIDVSSYQGNINWDEVYNSGYRFAFARASWGDENPPTYIDARFQENMENGHAAGMLMGAYHFAYPDYGTDAASEARHFLNVAGKYLTNGYLRPVLDLERGESLGWTALSNWVHEWVETVKNETGIEPILYTYTDYARNLDASVSQYDLWIAHWTCNPNSPPNTGIWPSWVFWQYYAPEYCGDNSNTVPGIDAAVDLDVFNGDMSRLETFLITACPSDNPPTVDAFNVTPDSVTLGDSFTISYTVSDDIGLDRAELWRANDSGGSPVDWAEIKRTSLSGTGPYSGSFSDDPLSEGVYWYGLHVVDNSGQLSVEPDPPGPIKVTVTPLSSPTGSLQVTISPQAAIDAGAQWRVDGGTWRNSGYTQSGLSVGSHTVEFKLISGWNKPNKQTVQINNNQTTTTTGTYTEQTLDELWKSPTATGNTYNTWIAPAKSYASDNEHAETAGFMQYQDYGGFGFNIPAGAIIEGVEVKIECHAGDLQRIWCILVPGAGKWAYTSTGSDGIVTIGGASDLWGQSWTPSDFSNANFQPYFYEGAYGQTVYVDHIQVKVYYTEPTFTITASAGPGGSISPSGTTQVASGGSQTYTITANTGYHISDVLVDGSSVGAVPSYTFTNVTANHMIAANFAVTGNGITGDFCGPNFGLPDGYVDVWDLMQFADHWHTRTGEGNWDSKYDLTGPNFGDLDGYIDVWDLMVFADHWHEGQKP